LFGSVAAPPPVIVNAYYGAAANETSLSTLIAAGATSRLTHLTYAFASMDTTDPATATNPCARAPTVYAGGPALINISDIQALRNQNPNIKVLISIGGASTTGVFEKAIANQGVKGLAQSCITTLLGGTYAGYIDGIDIDWEYPSNTTDEQNLNLLFQAFRNELNSYASEHNVSKHLLLTAAIPPEYQSNGWMYEDFAGKTYQPAANTFVDFYNVEFYDYSYNGSNTTYSNASLVDINEDIYGGSFYGAAGLIPVGGMPASKIVLGIPFYGVQYAGVTSGCALGGSGTLSNLFTYGDIMNTVLSDPTDYDNGCTNYTSPGVMNDSNGSAWSWNSSSGVFYEYDNPTTIQQKNSYVTANHLGGLFAWNLEDDTNASSYPGATAGVLLSAMSSQTLNYSDVSGSVSVTAPNGLAYNKIKHTGTETFTVTNTSGATISGPIQLVLWQMPANVTPVNNTGSFTGSPYWTVTSSSLIPGGSASVTVTLSYTSGATPTVTTNVYSGAF
jgi:chitinase